MFFFKKKNKIHHQVEQAYAEARRQGSVNLLSPMQVERVIAANDDIDMLDIQLRHQMNYPDIKYIITQLVPQNLHQTTRKPVTVEDIVTGVICGDIIGSKFEFVTHDYSAARIMSLPARKSYHTDDTVLTKATYAAIQKNPEHPDFRQAYLDAYQKEKGAGYGSTFVNWAENGQIFYTEGMVERRQDNTVGYHSCANGCVMRLSPIPAYYDDLQTAVKHAVASCMVTHNHVESVKATIVLTVAMWMALHGYSKRDIYDYCCTHYTMDDKLFYKASQFDMNTELHTMSNEISRASLMANYAVPFVIKCFYQTACYEDCMSEILAHYGDTDTLCAIAGGLCVAFYGTTGMDAQAILEADLRKI